MQLELFSHSHIKNGSSAKKRMPASFGIPIWHYQKFILIIFSFIVTAIASFSLGVEKGKKIENVKLNPHFDKAIKIQPPQEAQQIIKPAAQKADIVIPQKPADSLQGYTIQVATYQTKKYASQEANVLKKKGFSAVVVSKGAHTIICVGNFSDKETARSLLPQLKKRYRDCFIRRL